MNNDIELNDMLKSVGYEFKLREMFREEKSLSDRRVNYEKRIAIMIFDRNKEANLRETSRDSEKIKTLRRL